MAQAPQPGVGAQAARNEAAKVVVTITLCGESKSVAPMNLPMQESMICRKTTGLPIESFWNSEQAIGLDSVKVLWWLARRAEGETTLTLEQCWAEWPDDFTAADLDVQVTGPEGDDPEV